MAEVVGRVKFAIGLMKPVAEVVVGRFAIILDVRPNSN